MERRAIVMGVGLAAVVVGVALFAIRGRTKEEKIEARGIEESTRSEELAEEVGELREEISVLRDRLNRLESRGAAEAPARAASPRPDDASAPAGGGREEETAPHGRRDTPRRPPENVPPPTDPNETPQGMKALIGRSVRDLEAMAKEGNPHAFEAICRLLRDKDQEVREDAVDSFADVVEEIREKRGPVDPELIEHLRPLLADPSHKVREEVAQALRQFPVEQAAPMLEGMLGDKASSVVCDAIDALRDLKSKSSLPLIAPLAQSDNLDVVSQAGATLRRFGDEASADNVLHRLTPGLSSSDASVRRRALDRIRRVGGAQALPFLERLLEDEDPEVRERAAKAVKKLRKKYKKKEN